MSEVVCCVVLCRLSLQRRGRIEHAEEVAAADLADLVRSEGRFHHRIDDGIVEALRLVLPCLVRPLANSAGTGATVLTCAAAPPVDVASGPATSIGIL